MTRVLAVASEVFPLVKTGGLADVVGALPAALRSHDVDMRVLMPGYPAVMKALEGGEQLYARSDIFGGAMRMIGARAAGLDLFVLDAPHLFDRPGNPYLGPDGKDWPDNWKRFGALSFVAAEIGRGAIPRFVPEIVHVHDWQAALASVYLKQGVTLARSILTIHNLAFQGHFPAAVFPGLALPGSVNSIDGIEYYGGISFLKGGLQFADAITTVSPTYAEEICTPAGGMGMDGLLRARHHALHGIVNGIDTEIWNPETDPIIPARYSTRRLNARAINRQAIEQRLRLDIGPGPIFCIISRFAWQKGMDLVAACIDGAVHAGARFAVLGSGEPGLEALFRQAAQRHPGRVGIAFGYDEELAHLLQGGADAILVPSRFEPCGLTQFYGLRYGCVPVVARVGGLADTIIDANDAALNASAATGIQFLPVDTAGLMSGIRRAMALYADPPTWRKMQQRGMHADVSWHKSARRYADLYRAVAAS